MRNLTKSVAEAATASDREQNIWDGSLPGFGLRVRPSGHKSFILKYYNAKRQRRKLKIGRYGAVTVDEARSLAKKHLYAISQGADPAAERKAARRAMTVAALVAEYLDLAERGLILTRRGTPKAASTLAEDRYRLNAHVLPLIGRRPVKDISKIDANHFLRDVIAGKGKSRGGSGIAARTVGMVSGIFAYAVEEGYIVTNPFAAIRKPRGNVRIWRLDDAGYGRLGAFLKDQEETASWQFVAVVRLCALTGARLNEIQRLKKSEVDIAGAALRFAQTKTGRSVRPLGRAAIDIIVAAMARSDHAHVFPGITDPKKVHSGTTAWLARNARETIPGITSHGLRHSFASMAEDVGLSIPTIRCNRSKSRGNGARRSPPDNHRLPGYVRHQAQPVPARETGILS
ncbi:MAG: integrase family protein, partial [Alphaproteobacteria bacterium]|nr:integrase family protein [Alphaproteobacteria bacterium]